MCGAGCVAGACVVGAGGADGGGCCVGDGDVAASTNDDGGGFEGANKLGKDSSSM